VGSPLDYNKGELPGISEAGLGGHKYWIKGADTFCGSAVEGYLTPNRQGEGVSMEVYPPVLRRRMSMSTYLVYRVDDVLGILSSEASDRLDLIMVRENRHNQRDALVRGKWIAG
jgi:hypothetical protein